MIWREYIEGDIQNHPEVGGYKTVGLLDLFSVLRIPSDLKLFIIADEEGCLPIGPHSRNLP
jgi:hypothetical protein